VTIPFHTFCIGDEVTAKQAGGNVNETFDFPSESTTLETKLELVGSNDVAGLPTQLP
jgi:hypothetical protein